MIGTKEQLYTAVRDLTNRADLTETQLDTAIQLVEENISRELRPIKLEAFVELPVVNCEVEIPSSLLEIKMVQNGFGDVIDVRRTPEIVIRDFINLSNRDPDTGIPQLKAGSYARLENKLIFDGAVGDNIKLLFQQTVPSLLSEDPKTILAALDFLCYTPNVYLYGTAFHIGKVLGHSRTAEWQEDYANAGQAVQSHSDKANISGGTPIQDGAYNSPRNYYYG